MLGIGKKKDGIEVSAYGKHPAFDDFFSLNISPPLAKALSTWIESGIKSGETSEKEKETYVYRFWVLGIKKDELVMGIVRDSSDRLGRAYPLLILGSTRMKNRDLKWPAIFMDFESIFRAFEDITTARYEAFKEFEAQLLKVRFSEPEVTPKDTAFQNGLAAWFKAEAKKGSPALPVSELMDKFMSHAPLVTGIFKTNSPPPGAVFLGGRPETPMVHAYNRPLTTRDFHRLFNLSGFDQPGGHQNDMDVHTQ